MGPVKDMREGRVYLKDFVTITWTHIVPQAPW